MVSATQPFPDVAMNDSVTLIGYANTVTDGVLGTLFLMVGAIIMFGIMKQQGHRTSDSLTLSFFSMTLLGSFLWAIGDIASVPLVSGKILVLFFMFAIGSAIYSGLDR